uniref:Solute carrier organic anion transporter family member n=1 Tax=Steinernema glaseri TaxID=37863 RepID=A0A1I7YHM8_9BILA
MIDRFTVFIGVFALAFFLQEIGHTYMISVIQSIERQFHIPSKLTGFMVSASDIGYIPTVIFISYFGSKGNRAKWIGTGTLLVSLCCIMISTPNFLFPVRVPYLNVTNIQKKLEPPSELLDNKASINDYLNFTPISDGIPNDLKMRLLEKVVQFDALKHTAKRDFAPTGYEEHDNKSTRGLYTIDQPVMRQVLSHIKGFLNGSEGERPLINALSLYAHHRANNTENDLAITRRAAIAPFSFCGKVVNDLRTTVKDLKCEKKQSNFGPFVIIFTALVLLGVGKSTSWSLGMPLIDDNVKAKSTSLYFGGITLVRIMGPICGFLVGSIANHMYYSFPAKPPHGLSPTDPTWIGAWWFGYLLVGTLGIIPSLLLCFFPRKGSKVSPNQPSLKFFDKHRASESGKEKVTFMANYREVLASKVFLGSVIARVLDMFAFRGYKTFVTKYLSLHYGLPLFKATTYVALCMTLMFAAGTVLGGIFTRVSKLNGRQAAMFIVVLSVLNLMGFGTKGFLGCKSVVSQVGEMGRQSAFNFTNSCNDGCGCEEASLYPVCDSEGNAFYSPCHAGCRDVNVKNADTYDMVFTNCDCVANELRTVSKSNCQDDCSTMTFLFFAFSAFSAFCSGLGMVPHIMILLRCVRVGPREGTEPPRGGGGGKAAADGVTTDAGDK